MGISVREMLDSDFFKEYKVLAGHGGLNKQIQGIAVLDAPDGYRWTRGREFVVSAGYIFVQNPGLFEEYVQTEYFRNATCFGIKIGRYLSEIPDNILEAFNKSDVPLICIPSGDSWMDIMNAINVKVMNKNIRQFNIGEIKAHKFLDSSYHVRKIDKILSAIEYEMKFPAMLYDISKEKAQYSSHRFKEVSGNLTMEDFWNPSFNFSKEMLCDNLKMARYRFYDERYEKPFSWITVPITVENKIKAYFVVIEATSLIDYFDQFALRIGFLMIQDMYEQILVAQSIADTDFEKFINNILEEKLSGKEEIIKAANELNLGINNKSYVAIMKQTNKNLILAGYRDILKNCIRGTFEPNYLKMALIDDDKCLFLFKREEGFSEEQNIGLIREKLDNLKKRLELELKTDDVNLVFGMSDASDFIYEIKRNHGRAEQALNIGKLLYPSDNFWTYSQMGAFAWLDIKDDEIDLMMKDIDFLLSCEEHRELVHTLRVYLECKMNYSLTAKKLFVHINTVRKRIEEITDMTKLDLDNPMNRLKLEVLLKLFY
ncbi:sugar diacid utilization regulator [Peptoclostridium acidaminophilum DSM 3953]|uniref:Sugar diacid utilization regulator n=1 Tax=Peptoclostridium acidaminophilum DSM 3953 TaxID=1286171 RepID=W8T7Y9_PEPAC|nr:PucR family transcriptional regulator [Peptoclostridium acidaminophilum]AHM57005.1 sugar diacid utilization regulator [Peptoclostridium acidaminophilum DSM 3953]